MERADILIVKKGLMPSRQKAISAIKEGMVFVNGKALKKPSEQLDESVSIEIKGEILKYVSRGGFKLEGAIKFFNLQFKDKVVLDMGSSTGGFTDCALQHGAKKVYAVDVGSGQLAASLRRDNRVISMENTDIRSLSQEIFSECDFVVGDLSFISVVTILEYIKEFLTTQQLVLLIKPQFECGIEIAKKYKGTIKDYNLSKKICNETLSKIKKMGFKINAVADSPIKGGDGNSEFVVFIAK